MQIKTILFLIFLIMCSSTLTKNTKSNNEKKTSSGKTNIKSRIENKIKKTSKYCNLEA